MQCNNSNIGSDDRNIKIKIYQSIIVHPRHVLFIEIKMQALFRVFLTCYTFQEDRCERLESRGGIDFKFSVRPTSQICFSRVCNPLPYIRTKLK